MDFSEGILGQCNDCNASKSVAKILEDGRESVESDPHPGRPATSRTPENVEHVQAEINKDQRPTVQELEADLEIPKPTVFKIFMQDLGMKHVMAKFVQSFLLPEQKKHRTAVAKQILP